MAGISFEKSFASHEKAKYWSSKNELRPTQVYRGTVKKFIFDCIICKHSFETSPNVITNPKSSAWCPFCANQKLCSSLDCQMCFEKSFASHEKVKHWSNHLNTVKPRQIFKGTDKKYWFECNMCDHSFESSMCRITGGVSPSWCPFCSNQKLCSDVGCMKCFDKSFASHERANCWSAKNVTTARQVFKATSHKYIFECNVCHHESLRPVIDVSSGREFCRYSCSRFPIFCPKDKHCKLCINNSFASHEMSACWSSKNKSNPEEVYIKSNQSYIFDCNKCHHEFTWKLVQFSTNKTPCPFCANLEIGRAHV